MGGWRCEWEPTVTGHFYLQITAPTSEENLTKSIQTVEEELGKIIEGFVTGAEDIISGASRITKS